MLSPDNAEVYDLWQACRRHHCLPDLGGAQQQCPWLMLCFDLLWQIWEAHESAEREAFSALPLLRLLGQ